MAATLATRWDDQKLSRTELRECHTPCEGEARRRAPGLLLRFASVCDSLIRRRASVQSSAKSRHFPSILSGLPDFIVRDTLSMSPPGF